MTIGRLLIRSHGTRGPGLRLRFFGPPTTYRGVELWLGRRMTTAWWMHGRACDCGVCREDREIMEMYR